MLDAKHEASIIVRDADFAGTGGLKPLCACYPSVRACYTASNDCNAVPSIAIVVLTAAVAEIFVLGRGKE